MPASTTSRLKTTPSAGPILQPAQRHRPRQRHRLQAHRARAQHHLATPSRCARSRADRGDVTCRCGPAAPRSTTPPRAETSRALRLAPTRPTSAPPGQHQPMADLLGAAQRPVAFRRVQTVGWLRGASAATRRFPSRAQLPGFRYSPPFRRCNRTQGHNQHTSWQ